MSIEHYNFELFPTETRFFFEFLTTLPPFWTVFQISLLFSLESFPNAFVQRSILFYLSFKWGMNTNFGQQLKVVLGGIENKKCWSNMK